MVDIKEKKYSFEFTYDQYLLILNALSLSAKYFDDGISYLFRDLYDQIFIVPDVFK